VRCFIWTRVHHCGSSADERRPPHGIEAWHPGGVANALERLCFTTCTCWLLPLRLLLEFLSKLLHALFVNPVCLHLHPLCFPLIFPWIRFGLWKHGLRTWANRRWVGGAPCHCCTPAQPCLTLRGCVHHSRKKCDRCCTHWGYDCNAPQCLASF